MIKIVNESIESFHNDITDKKFFLFGAGRRAVHFYDALSLENKITGIIDNNEKLWNKDFCVMEEKIPIFNIDVFLKYVKNKNLSDIVLLITPSFYAWKIVEQLDNISELEGLRCYVGDLLMEYYEKQDFSFTKGMQKIPKKIHYCWFGKNEIPKNLQKYMDTWKEKCPDYEIVRWDENNYDISKNRYMKEAYECGKWGFVPDYARLDIIYQEGGIYLDTDIELLTSLNKMLCDDMFCGAANNSAINFGQGFGAVRGHKIIKDLRDFYDDISFYNTDGGMNLKPCYMYQHPVLEKYGFVIRNKYQKRDGMVIYPSEVFAPTGMKGLQNNFTENTILIHHSELSWISVEERCNLEEYKKHIIHRKIYGREINE